MGGLLSDLSVKIFGDGADLPGILELYANPLISGFTTNPTLMRKAGIEDYEAFSKELLAAVPDRPISLEVFTDEFDDMERQALKIASWGDNVYAKIPVTNSRGDSSEKLVQRLAEQGRPVGIGVVEVARDGEGIDHRGVAAGW